MNEIVVLMSTYNGEKYLRIQLDSILAQQGVKVRLLVRDDGSTDHTLQILQEYALQDKLTYYEGSNVKPAKSFMELVRKAPPAEFYAFADQDDYWLPEKLLHAVEKLSSLPSNTPALYHGKTTLVDENLKEKEFKEMPTYYCYKFSHVLISFLAIGCTFVFNKSLRDILCQYVPHYQIAHDNWVDQVCRAVGGKVVYDSQSYIYYRQHGNNVSGGTSSLIKKWKKRFLNLLSNRCMRSNSVEELVKGYQYLMPAENLAICQKILNYRKNWRGKYALLRDSTIRTGQRRLDVNYLISVLLGIF